jgi:hypothetical protein
MRVRGRGHSSHSAASMRVRGRGHSLHSAAAMRVRGRGHFLHSAASMRWFMSMYEKDLILAICFELIFLSIIKYFVFKMLQFFMFVIFAFFFKFLKLHIYLLNDICCK